MHLKEPLRESVGLMEKERVSGPIDGLSKLQIDRLATFVTGGETEEAERSRRWRLLRREGGPAEEGKAPSLIARPPPSASAPKGQTEWVGSVSQSRRQRHPSRN